MAIVTKQELLDRLSTYIGEDTSDEALALIEDFSDTVVPQDETTDWKKKYEDNDKEWRQKYRDRFFNKSAEEPEEPEEPEESEEHKRNFSDLFKTE